MTHWHHKEWLTTPIAIVAAGALIGLGIYGGATEIAKAGFGSSNSVTTVAAKTAAAPTVNAVASVKPGPVTAQDHIRGNVNAKVAVIEYSDLECPFCKRFHATLKEVTAKYAKSDVAWVYRHFPLPMHDKAPKEAEATECAAEQGGNDKFWAYVDRLFEVSPTNNKLEPSELPKIAAYVGLDVPAFEKCLTSGKYAAKVAAHIKDGQAAGARGTPYNVIVTKKGATPLNGAVSADTLDKAIKDALAN